MGLNYDFDVDYQNVTCSELHYITGGHNIDTLPFISTSIPLQESPPRAILNQRINLLIYGGKTPLVLIITRGTGTGGGSGDSRLAASEAGSA
jgi:hypothetical protein